MCVDFCCAEHEVGPAAAHWPPMGASSAETLKKFKEMYPLRWLTFGRAKMAEPIISSQKKS
jgi:hypothetical protein